jgi:hypothetical protein
MQSMGDRPPAGNYPPYPPPEKPRGGKGFAAFTKTPAFEYALKGLGLVGVAVLSGLLWYLVRNNPNAPTHGAPPTQPAAGAYSFEPYHSAQTETDCAAHSTQQVQRFFRRQPCVSLTRSLYTTKLPDDSRVITSVVVVKMTTPQQATDLRALSDLDGSGHVKDLVEDGVSVPGGPNGLQDAGYESSVSGSSLIVTMTEFMDSTQDTKVNLDGHKDALKAVSTDAFRLATTG